MKHNAIPAHAITEVSSGQGAAQKSSARAADQKGLKQRINRHEGD